MAMTPRNESGPVPLMPATRQRVGNQVAYRIRAELVCCRVYSLINDTRDLTLEEAVASPIWHPVCYWGEAAARLAEDPTAWGGDPSASVIGLFSYPHACHEDCEHLPLPPSPPPPPSQPDQPDQRPRSPRG